MRTQTRQIAKLDIFLRNYKILFTARHENKHPHNSVDHPADSLSSTGPLVVSSSASRKQRALPSDVVPTTFSLKYSRFPVQSFPPKQNSVLTSIYSEPPIKYSV